MVQEVLAKIQSAHARGASHVELVRVALACARAVQHLAPAGFTDAQACIQSAERWLREPSSDHLLATMQAEMEAFNLRGVDKRLIQNGSCHDLWALLSAAVAASCCYHGRNLPLDRIQLSADYACRAGTGMGIDIVAVVTAELL